MATPAITPIRRSLRWVLNAVLPPQCLACDVIVETPGRLCGACWRSIDFVRSPQCDACGLPFELDMGPGALCGACAADRPPFDRARAGMRYGGIARDLVLAFKHGDRTHAAPGLARLMADAGRELVAAADICLPVPLHRWRLARRRFNQAALLAQELAREADLAVLLGALRRVRRTPSQGSLSRRARYRNVRGAFQLNHKVASEISGQTVLLVDDVYTTGATVSECSRVLRRAGAKTVDVLTLARVLRDGKDDQA